MTTKNDEPEFLLTPNDPEYKAPKQPKPAKPAEHVSIRVKKIRQPGIIKTYFQCMTEVILA